MWDINTPEGNSMFRHYLKLSKNSGVRFLAENKMFVSLTIFSDFFKIYHLLTIYFFLRCLRKIILEIIIGWLFVVFNGSFLTPCLVKCIKSGTYNILGIKSMNRKPSNVAVYFNHQKYH